MNSRQARLILRGRRGRLLAGLGRCYRLIVRGYGSSRELLTWHSLRRNGFDFASYSRYNGDPDGEERTAACHHSK